MPRRNPSRKSRPSNISNGLDYRPITRSMTRVQSNGSSVSDDCDLIEGLKDEQEVRRVAIRTR